VKTKKAKLKYSNNASAYNPPLQLEFNCRKTTPTKNFQVIETSNITVNQGAFITQLYS